VIGVTRGLAPDLICMDQPAQMSVDANLTILNCVILGVENVSARKVFPELAVKGLVLYIPMDRNVARFAVVRMEPSVILLMDPAPVHLAG